ncbi:MAG: ParA family protein [Rhizobium sp.]|nr:ParA family protein [Rhizobium sp.]
MPVISFANTKGGAGKTTALLLLATELIRRGKTVCVVDTDPQRWISRWFEGASAPGDKVMLATYVTAYTLQRTIEENAPKFDYVLVDLPGSQSPLLATAIGLSDHILIPIQGSSMDAQGGAQVLEILAYLDQRANISIPHSVVLSRVNSMITTRSMLVVKGLLAQRSVHVLDTPLIERAPFRDMFDLKTYLHLMDPAKASNLDKALANAAAFADEVIDLAEKSRQKPRIRAA